MVWFRDFDRHTKRLAIMLTGGRVKNFAEIMFTKGKLLCSLLALRKIFIHLQAKNSTHFSDEIGLKFALFPAKNLYGVKLVHGQMFVFHDSIQGISSLYAVVLKTTSCYCSFTERPPLLIHFQG